MPNGTEEFVEAVTGRSAAQILEQLSSNNASLYNSLLNNGLQSSITIDESTQLKNVVKTNQRKCCICNQPAPLMNSNAVWYCQKHFSQLIAKCDRCNCFYDKRDITYIQSQNLCCNCMNSKHYSYCSKCHQWKKYCIYIENVGLFCRDCAQEIEYFTCSNCDRTYPIERYGVNNYCISCTNNNLTQVRNYSYKPQPRFFKKQNIIDDQLYFGVQLQMGGVEDYNMVNEFVAEYSNSFFYMKKDTSIPVYGCEIVTQPATMCKHIDNRYWKTMLDVAKQYGFNADNDKCGVHVHISRDFFTNYEIAKLDCFVNTYSFFKKIARRQSHYSEYLQKPSDFWGSQITNRKCALNLSNSNTVEMRIFKGTIEYDYIMAYIEFCHAIAVFVKAVEMDEILNSKRTTIAKFRKLIQSNKYKYIKDYCKTFNVFDGE